MTYLFNDPARFMEDMREGFLDAHRDLVAGVPGGVIRALAPERPKVAVVVGGGSGHYPAFCGIVGSGFADGAIIGNIFTSPSVSDAYSVATSASSGAGVIISAGNYAGDRMNFALAAERLIADGIDTRVVLVTDDVASAPTDEVANRRGIAGDFTVFKIGSAAAEEGLDLDGVEALMRRANERTRTLGVAFSGCTMPGATDPLFSVPDGKMSIGLGIHGEPGVRDVPLASANELADTLVDGVLAEAVRGSDRVAVILNGLGTVKYEELFVLWRRIAARLRDSGLTLVEPEVGELVTSLDMGGCSLTVTWLDDELERLWRAPATTPAYRKGRTASDGHARAATQVLAVQERLFDASDRSRALATRIVEALDLAERAMRDAEEELGRIDAIAGDGDHGRGMVRGVSAARRAAREVARLDGGASDVLSAAGDAWADEAGGTSGVLWGAALRAASIELSGDDPTSHAALSRATSAAIEAIETLGKAQVGDKTMLDAMVPFRDRLAEALDAGATPGVAWSEAADEAGRSAEATAGLTPRVGRARPLAKRSVGTPDAGARSFAMLVDAIRGLFYDDPSRTRS